MGEVPQGGDATVTPRFAEVVAEDIVAVLEQARALAQSAEGLLAAGLASAARPLVRQLVALLEAPRAGSSEEERYRVEAARTTANE